MNDGEKREGRFLDPFFFFWCRNVEINKGFYGEKKNKPPIFEKNLI